jgi:hypothetical protein
MSRILRGEIWWADLNPVRGHEHGLKSVKFGLSIERLSTKIAEISVEELDRMIAGLNELIGD